MGGTPGTIYAVDAANLAALIAEHSMGLRRFISARVAGDDADDVYAEVLLAAHLALRRRPQQLSVGWLMTVARRRVADHWRCVERDRRRELRLRVRHLVEPQVDFTSRVDAHSEINKQLARLPGNQGIALRLRYLQGYSVIAVADQLNLSSEACESLLARGRRSLRQRLAYRSASPLILSSSPNQR